MHKFYNIHIIWLLLVLLTLLTYGLSYADASGTTLMWILVGTAYIKSVMIIREFMELKGVSLLWKVLMYGWLSVVCFAVILAYLLA